MFTGIIERLGTIVTVGRGSHSAYLAVEPDSGEFDVAVGASVAIDGVCLTLERMDGRVCRFTAVQETLRRTTFAQAHTGRRVNLERALVAGGRLDGHIVQGHVDGVGTIAYDRPEGDSIVRGIRIPNVLARYMAVKGSVALDGISLTIATAHEDIIEIAFIPHTLSHTTMAGRRPGEAVNVECDVLARYMERLMRGAQGGGDEGLYAKLERYGF